MTTSTLLFSVTLRHLSGDGKKAAPDLPPVQLHYVDPDQLHALLRAVNGIAAMVNPPTEPEVRISGPTGEFVVRVKEGRLHLITWSSAHKGGAATPAEIIAVVTQDSSDVSDDPGARRRDVAGAPKGRNDKRSIIAMAIAIVLVNCFTVWILTRPPRSVAAKCRPLEREPADRLLAEVAGTYETGKSPGDRRLEIRRDASAQRIKLAADGAIKDQQTFTVQPATAEGKRVLVTSRKSVITVKDNVSVLLYGDTYKRVTN